MSYYNPPMKVGQYTTSTTLSGDLKKIYRLNTGVFRWVTNSAAISNAGGKTVLLTMVSGAPDGTVTESATAAANNIAGVIPIGTSGQGGSIALTTTLAASSYFLVQLSGQAQVQAANTTCVYPYPLITTTTAGGVGSYSTVALQVADALGLLGYATNTVAATAAGQLITCVLTRAA